MDTITPDEGTVTYMVDVDDYTFHWETEEEERPQHYFPGSYHPVEIGDQFSNGRYTIVHKLGHGGYSTVWLARDEKHGQFVALKIMVPEQQSQSEAHNYGIEIEFLRELHQIPTNHPGKLMLMSCLDSFSHDGSNGSHLCFVSLPHRMSIGQSRHESHGTGTFKLQAARAMAAQMIIMLSFLHSNGVVHGDFTPNNVLLAPPDLSHLSTEDLYHKYGEPIKAMTERRDGKPIPAGVPPYIVPEIWFGDRSTELELQNAKLTLTDFGEAWKPALRSRYQLNTPDNYRAPEANFAEKENVPIGFPSDIWSLGVGIFEIFGNHLFEGSPDPDGMLEDMINTLGKPPQRWWDLWEAKDEFFRGDVEWDEDGTYPYREHILLEERVCGWIGDAHRDEMTNEEIEDLYSLIKGVLCWEPDDRLTADELLRGGWMKRWGLPALQAMYEARGESRNIMSEIDSIDRMELATAEKGGSTRWQAAASGVTMPEFAAAWWMKVRGLLGFPRA
ncbi:Serine/threonine-protein kinase SRPK [Colletotrichum siamense]|uniref:EKC/KEOPS complex subunit BUD32 n=1 Tax=Colletotrichum siamense TaxID=690259 RepID=A0A9P5EZB2_COLSI|nr:Serine/threonine-protein kinase SRPK [Colletotrichum siamense]KAF4862325.1 Serine/threonine-protein kinase SRPK [Colletotrichum siamense]